MIRLWNNTRPRSERIIRSHVYNSFTDWTADNPIPRTPSTVSPIKHVFYILKELRTYDDYFGDMEKGNGDSSNAKYGRKVAVNHQALGGEFVLLDNFYADRQASASGMHWSTGAYSNDYVEDDADVIRTARRRI